jgi:putative endonuclease
VSGWVYILTNKPLGVLYTGVTAQLSGRLEQHRSGRGSSFARRDLLVFAEHHDDSVQAIWCEKCIKCWDRQWKLRLIQELNPRWRDLAGELHLA